MAIKTDTIEKIPQWVTTYFLYGDDSALGPEDKKEADDFYDKLMDKGLRLICPIEGTESEFEPYPAFGLACNTIDWTAEVLPEPLGIVCADKERGGKAK